MGINDRDVARSIDIIQSEFENLEKIIEQNNDTITELERLNAALESEIKASQEFIQELEEALAEAYLTDNGG